MTVPHQTGRARSGDVSIHYRRLGKGSGTPLVIVHGLSYFSYDWLEIAAKLGAEREVVCMDMRGFGDSDWSAQKDYTVPSMSADIVALLDHLGWKRAALAGHSMGGRSVIHCAAKSAARVAGIVLVDFSPESSPAGTKRIAGIVAGVPDKFASVDEAMQYFGAPEAKRARFEAYLKPADGGFIVKRDTQFRDNFRRMLETGERPKLGVDMWQLLGEARCPVLSLRGARSDMYLAETVAKMKAANARLQVVEVDAGHNIGGENPEGFLAAVRPFLASLEEKSHDKAA
jgi:pimeloyl-ACP methyl ester carboxylesterase